VLLSPSFEIVGVSDSFAEATLVRPDEIVGRSVFEAFPENPAAPESQNASRIRDLLGRVLGQREPHQMGLTRYDVRDRAGVFVERYWTGLSQPVLDERRGEVALLLNSATDETDRVLRERAMAERALDPVEALRLVVGQHFDDGATLVDLLLAATGLERKSPIEARLDSLTAREKEVFRLALQGKPSKVIGFDMGISLRTVEVYRTNILRKLQVRNFFEIVRLIDAKSLSDNDNGNGYLRTPTLQYILEGRTRLNRLYALIDKMRLKDQDTKEAEEILKRLKGIQSKSESEYITMIYDAQERRKVNMGYP
jgi:DNA-binding CsgD family transcriptional regulator